MANMMYFDANSSQHQNIRYKSKKQGIMEIFDGNNWVMEPETVSIQRIIDRCFDIVGTYIHGPNTMVSDAIKSKFDEQAITMKWSREKPRQSSTFYDVKNRLLMMFLNQQSNRGE